MQVVMQHMPTRLIPPFLSMDSHKHHCSHCFPAGVELSALVHAPLSDVTDAVGKYRFAEAELM